MVSFPVNTDWTAISRARHLPPDHTARRDCLSWMAEHYQGPVRAMMRAWGLRNEHDLDDAVQDFFTKFLEKNWLDMLSREKGRFRGFLRVSVRHFLVDRARRRRPAPAPLPDDDALASSDPAPDEAFDRAWARQLIQETVSRFREECEARGLPHYWTLFERHVLADDAAAPSVRASAEALGVTEKEAANYLYRARRRFAELSREAIRQTVNGGESDVQAEVELLRGLL